MTVDRPPIPTEQRKPAWRLACLAYRAKRRIANLTATSATSDEELVASWVGNLRSEHSRINFRTTADRFLAALVVPMRRATVAVMMR
jgi:hypothetical protein